MKVKGPSHRAKWDYTQEVKIPEKLKTYLWDHQDQAPLEKLIYRTLYYGSYDDIKFIFSLYPDETLKICLKYPDIHRGVRYWIKTWHESRK
ncbi:conserved hypothetical protein [Thermosulfidibacter takaii ABI70S6]|uniref:Uncharacterized protein n=1 Tax=Thermosulfidibacter takaii (strain DSM 17441 / JCM 13301 / NBRC 103674 / ABI70S6) TaxID=1298851 RepID=A0A0S3QRF4_THET7|nr:hypothetical protein [Thermosulfidibacter takaii]BAT70873.1 conserved hypothetical protein [Thermosulfidibacter takaii ABI70S6]